MSHNCQIIDPALWLSLALATQRLFDVLLVAVASSKFAVQLCGLHSTANAVDVDVDGIATFGKVGID